MEVHTYSTFMNRGVFKLSEGTDKRFSTFINRGVFALPEGLEWRYEYMYVVHLLTKGPLLSQMVQRRYIYLQRRLYAPCGYRLELQYIY